MVVLHGGNFNSWRGILCNCCWRVTQGLFFPNSQVGWAGQKPGLQMERQCCSFGPRHCYRFQALEEEDALLAGCSPYFKTTYSAFSITDCSSTGTQMAQSFFHCAFQRATPVSFLEYSIPVPPPRMAVMSASKWLRRAYSRGFTEYPLFPPH